MDINALKLKTSPELSDQEKDYIKQNIDQLNDEDKAAYADFLPVEPEPEAVEVKEETVQPEGKVETVVEEKQEDQSFAFKSEDDAKAFVERINKEQQTQKQAAIDAAATPEEKKYVEENWKPADWNEGFRKTVEIVKSELKAEADKKAEDDAVKYWQDQWTDLSKEKQLKPLDDPEGRKVHNQIINIMRAYGANTFKEGYEMWEKFETVRNAAPTTVIEPKTDKSKTDALKKAASKIGASSATEEKTKDTAGVKPFASYEEMKKTSSRGILRGL